MGACPGHGPSDEGVLCARLAPAAWMEQCKPRSIPHIPLYSFALPGFYRAEILHVSLMAAICSFGRLIQRVHKPVGAYA